MYKLIVSDLDGTLLGSDHRVSDFTVETVKSLADKGYRFAIATGRHYLDVKAVAEKMDNVEFLITSNGARIHDHEGNQIYSDNLDISVVENLLEISKGFKGHRNIYKSEHWFVEKENKRLLEFYADSKFSYEIVDFKGLTYEGITKLFFIGPHEDLMSLERKIREKYDDSLNITLSLDDCLEVMSGHVSKGQALEKIFDLTGITAEQTVVFGDAMNDLEMLGLAGLPVVMENCHSDLKAKLGRYEITCSSSKNGVAKYLKEKILK